ncbi:MAG: hypothetical protein AAF497_26155, partial [Planctomycetota bacterium]
MTDESKQEVSSDFEATNEQPPEAPQKRKPKFGDNPFDYPYVFPGLLFVLGLWFGYDGWLNPECKSIGFNRIMSVVFAFFFVWTLKTDIRMAKKLKERREAAAAEA